MSDVGGGIGLSSILYSLQLKIPFDAHKMAWQRTKQCKTRLWNSCFLRIYTLIHTAKPYNSQGLLLLLKYKCCFKLSHFKQIRKNSKQLLCGRLTDDSEKSVSSMSIIPLTAALFVSFVTRWS